VRHLHRLESCRQWNTPDRFRFARTVMRIRSLLLQSWQVANCRGGIIVDAHSHCCDLRHARQRNTQQAKNACEYPHEATRWLQHSFLHFFLWCQQIANLSEWQGPDSNYEW